MQDSRGTNGTSGQSDRTISGHDDQGSNETGFFIRRNNLWVVDKNSKNPFNNEKLSQASYRELPQDINSGNSFYNAIVQAKVELGDLGASIHTYSPEEYTQMKLFLSEDGLSGIAVKPDGEIVSLFSRAGKLKNDRGRGHSLVELAKQNGGTKLNAFDTYLPNFYKKHGFEGISEKQYVLKDKDGNKLGFIEYSTSDGVLDIGQVTNTTKRKINFKTG